MPVSSLLRRHATTLALAAVLIALCAKFFWPLYRFEIPMGYDLGIYRYLFLKHAEGFPPFIVADMQPWAYEHPLGLFFFSTILLKLGVPVDWLTGWIWNLMPVLLAGALAWVWQRREGGSVGVLVLLCVFFSQAFFDGFASMYWKTFLSLTFTVFAFSALERRSSLVIPWGILAVATHHQTGLIVGLTIALWVLFRLVLSAREGRVFTRELLFGLGAGLLILGVGLVWYLPVWGVAVQPLLTRLASSEAAGSFPAPLYYLKTTGILLAFGAYGYLTSWKREHGTPWQLAVLICLTFIALQLIFFRRFFLQLDFFLLPFAAMGIIQAWKRFSSVPGNIALIALLMMQAYLSMAAAATRTPAIDAATYDSIRALDAQISQKSIVVALDNQTAPYLLGWLPEHAVGGPGLFHWPGWTYAQWEQFITGSNDDRKALLGTHGRPFYMYASPYFRSFYGAQADKVVNDPCFEPQRDANLLKVVCPPIIPPQ